MTNLDKFSMILLFVSQSTYVFLSLLLWDAEIRKRIRAGEEYSNVKSFLKILFICTWPLVAISIGKLFH